jgi:hypothetical protein
VSVEAREWQLADPAAMAAIAAHFADSPVAIATYGWTCGVIEGIGPALVRLTASQVAVRRRIGFAWLWSPGRWLADPGIDVVLSVGLPSRIDSPRFREVVEPYPGRFMHHFAVQDPAELDPEVAGWLAAAYDAAR